MQNVPCGHGDDGDLCTSTNLKENLSNFYYANFRALARFRIEAGDIVLANHMKSANAKNELISCWAERHLKLLSKESNKVHIWLSIVFDESTDVSHQSQLTFALLYVYDRIIHEDFVE